MRGTTSTLFVMVMTWLGWAVPAHAADAFTGPDILWRTHDWLVFYLYDASGEGMNLQVDVRDMNTYVQAPRPIQLLVIGPEDEILARQLVEDDGIVGGDPEHCDGIYDPFQDARFRQWHHRFSPDGYPPGKRRSPYLTNPQDLPVRQQTLKVLAGSPGIYRVYVMATWDTWISLTPDRPLPAAVHPGTGPFYVHGDRFNDVWFWAPPGVKDLGFRITEEVAPYNWQLTLLDEMGEELGRTEPRGFCSYLIHPAAAGDKLYNLRVTGNSPGCNLHLGGFPAILAPDRDTARLFRGGIEIDKRGRWLYHQHQKALLRWAESLTPEAVAVKVHPPKTPFVVSDTWVRPAVTTSDIPAILETQDLDPSSPTYGRFRPSGNPALDRRFTFFNQQADCLAAAAAAPEAGDYYSHPGLIRRIVLARIVSDLVKLGPTLSYDIDADFPQVYTIKSDSFWGPPWRSSWYIMGHDVKHIQTALKIREVIDGAVPSDVVDRWKKSVRLWGHGRAIVQAGECSNQWCENLSYLSQVLTWVPDDYLREALGQNITLLTTPGAWGRTNPTITPDARGAKFGYGGLRADVGRLGCGTLGDGFGFDAEYGNEQVTFIREAWSFTRHPGIADWCKDFYRLKAHLAMPVSGMPGDPLTCPTDMSHRTPYHKAVTPVLPETDQFPYASIFKAGQDRDSKLPCMESGAFVRSIDDIFHFVKTPSYYAIAYSGDATPLHQVFGYLARSENGTTELLGFGPQGYGHKYWLPSKLAGLSAVFVPDCGPVLLSSAQDVSLTNNLWGRLKQPIPVPIASEIDGRVISGSLVVPISEFDGKQRTLRKSGEILFTPLKWERTIRFMDDRLSVHLIVRADEAVELDELYECLPVMVVDKQVRLFDASMTDVGLCRFTADAQKANPQVLPGDRLVLAFDVAARAGAGALFRLDHPYRIHVEPQFKGAGTGSINLALPTQFTANESIEVRYEIRTHAEPVTSALTEPEP